MAKITLVFNKEEGAYINGDIRLTTTQYVGDNYKTIDITTPKGNYSGKTNRPDTYFGRVIGEHNPYKGYFFVEGKSYKLEFSEDWESVTIEY